MIRVGIVVEGRTELEFVRQSLANHVVEYGVLVTPVLIGRRGHAGGNVTVERLASDMAAFSYNHDAVTTLVDFYGFRHRPTDDVEELERQINNAYDGMPHAALPGDRVFSYVQRHEFEALLFSDVSAFARVPDFPRNVDSALAGVRAQFVNPEDINDSPDTAPSKRILDAVPDYNKVTDGPDIAREVGLEAMRKECPRFAAWLARIESLGSDS